MNRKWKQIQSRKVANTVSVSYLLVSVRHQSLMHMIFKDIVVYLDDMLAYSKSQQEHD